jgi:hypothetical protein
MQAFQNHIKILVIVLSFSLPAWGSIASEAEAAKGVDPLDFLTPIMGVWVPHPDWAPLQDNSELQTLVPLNLSWDQTKKAIHIQEGVPQFGQYTDGILVWNAASQQAEFTAWQNEDFLVFKGIYQTTKDGDVERIYDVIDRAGKVRKFRETFRLETENRLNWKTEIWKQGKWLSRDGKDTPGFQAVRAATTPTANLDALSPLLGNWHPVPGSLSESYTNWRQTNNIGDSFVSFVFGTDQRWMEFGDWRKQDGIWRHQGAGLIAWHPSKRQLRFTEHGAREVAVAGNMDVISDHVFRRNIQVFRPGGSSWIQRDTWTILPDNPDCMNWQATYVSGEKSSAMPPYTLCRGQGVNQPAPKELLPE